MEIQLQRQHVEGSEAIESYDFGIKVTAKSFHLMISQLYKDPVAAFIRELSTNAYEAHQMLDIEKEPFQIWLPSLMSPSFKIRDFGPGLSKEEVRKVYVMLFESTKTNSNEMGGCFGLGSKSPFAYSMDVQFGVISYNDGMKSCYTVFKNELGFPKMNLVHQEPSNERTGVEISIPISREDHMSVAAKARQIYRWFATTPTLMSGGTPFTKLSPTIQGSNFGRYEKSDVNRAAARMGNIVYTIDSSLCNLHNLEYYPIVVEFPIGALSPEPSREGLSYDKKTKREIEEAFLSIKAEMIAKIQPQVDLAKDYFDAIVKATNLIINSPVLLNELNFKGEILNHNFGVLEDTVGFHKYLRDGKLKNNSTDIVIPKDGSLFFLLDKRCAYQQIIKAYIRDNQLSGNRIYICDTIYNSHTVDPFASFLRIDKSRIVKVSEVPYTPTPRYVGPRTTSATRHITKMFTWCRNDFISESWTDADVDIKTQNGMYVVVYKNKILVAGKEIHPNQLQYLIDLIGYTGTIYGVKKDMVAKVESTGKWTNFLDYAENLAYNAIQATSAEDSKDAAKLLQSMRYRRCTSHDFVEKIVCMNIDINQYDVKRAVSEYKKIQKLCQLNHTQLSNIAYEFYGKQLSDFVTKKSFNVDRYPELLDIVNKKFPLTTVIDSDDIEILQEMSHYIVTKGK